jgi:N-acetylglutamate synthase-like GNAT family acetyltransferase
MAVSVILFPFLMQLLLKVPSDADFDLIRNYIHAFELDDRGLKKEEFCAAFDQHELRGFGRLRKHPDCTELCSLGVVTSHRNKGIGKAITAELIRTAPHTTIYVVCIIPHFFVPFGFKEVTTYPVSIKEKLEYCTQSLPVPEPYVAMCLQNDKVY